MESMSDERKKELVNTILSVVQDTDIYWDIDLIRFPNESNGAMGKICHYTLIDFQVSTVKYIHIL